MVGRQLRRPVMPTWMWLNIPLLVLVFAAVVGISYWLVLKHPDEKAPATFEPAPGTKAFVPPEPATAEPAAAEPATAEAAARRADVPAQGRRDVRDERERRPRFPVSTGRR
jgi:hypothetical protein